MTTIGGTDLSSSPGSDLDPYADDFLIDPFAALAALRAAGPAVYLTRYDVWAVSRYTDVYAVLRDHERVTSTAGVGLVNLNDDAYGWRPRSLLLEFNPPQHTVNWAAVVSAMTPPGAAHLSGAVRRCTYKSFPDMPHGMHMYQPQTYADTLVEWTSGLGLT